MKKRCTDILCFTFRKTIIERVFQIVVTFCILYIVTFSVKIEIGLNFSDWGVRFLVDFKRDKYSIVHFVKPKRTIQSLLRYCTKEIFIFIKVIEWKYCLNTMRTVPSRRDIIWLSVKPHTRSVMLRIAVFTLHMFTKGLHLFMACFTYWTQDRHDTNKHRNQIHRHWAHGIQSDISLVRK